MQFALLLAGLRTERHNDRPLEHGVGKRLEPDDLAEPGRPRRFNIRHVPLLSLASTDCTTYVDASVSADPV
jgi:hypothetical protein